MIGSLPYLIGDHKEYSGLLARYLPPLTQGAARDWLGGILQPAEWVLDPFGAAPDITLEAARSGYRLLVAANNPIARFLLEMKATPARPEELTAVIAELASARIGDQRLEPYLRSLYQTDCHACGGAVEAEAFVWERGGEHPVAKVYRCSHCGDSGERPASRGDIERAAAITLQAQLHQARALERVASLSDPDRQHAEEALEVYLPRAVLALFTLINKIEGLGLNPQRKDWLRLLLLSACDKANSLWQHPPAKNRPKQLQLGQAALFREHNVWLALEEAVAECSSTAAHLRIYEWQTAADQVEPGGILIFEGRLKDLASQLGDFPLKAVLAPLPRQNQAFWTLSALWAGWLWGREAAAPFKSVLRRRRYDWSWHAAALYAALSSLSPNIPEGTPALGLIGEAEPGFLSAAMMAADSAGFATQGVAMRHQDDQAQIHWVRTARPIPTQPPDTSLLEQAAVAAAQKLIQQRGEPCPYLPVHIAVLDELINKGVFNLASEPPSGPDASELQPILQNYLSYKNGFLRYGGSSSSLESGYWWLKETSAINPPLADRVEFSLVKFLVSAGRVSLKAADQAVCSELPGLLTPDPHLVQAVLGSYAEPDEGAAGLWRLREQDRPTNRKLELAEMRASLAALGQKLGFIVEQGDILVWKTSTGQISSAFYIMASAALGTLIRWRAYSPGQSVVVLPGGRANLVMFKLRRDPRLQQIVDSGWRFLKFRHLRRLAEEPNLTAENFPEFLSLDPLTYNAAQMQLL